MKANHNKDEVHSLEEAKCACQLEKNKDIAHYRAMRKDIADKVYYFLVIWCIALFLILMFQGWCQGFHLHEPILITLCGGTTISTIGLVGFIVKGLFGGNSKNDSET